MFKGLFILVLIVVVSLPGWAKNVIFFHPDGNSLSHWTAYRIAFVGPDKKSVWDELAHQGVYRGHLKDQLAATSNAAATIHAYGVKVVASSFGMDGETPIKSASGFDGSIAHEALARGKAVALVQTGHIAEPGTAAYVAKVPQRSQYDEIAKQVVQSGVQVLMSGGEKYLLPKGVAGKFGKGERADDLNLIEWAKSQGYQIVYTKGELEKAAANKNTKKLLGIFAWDNTYNDLTEEELRKKKLPLYLESAPTVKEMSEAAIKILKRYPKGYLALIEEEATDNFSNILNAKGALEAGRRSLEAVAYFREVVKASPRDTLLLMASDSDASGLQLYSSATRISVDQALPERKDMIVDGRDGTGTLPFISAPDQFGQTFPFAIVWAGGPDFTGGILAKAEGYRANKLPSDMDNTEVFKMIHQGLFKNSKFRK